MFSLTALRVWSAGPQNSFFPRVGLGSRQDCRWQLHYLVRYLLSSFCSDATPVLPQQFPSLKDVTPGAAFRVTEFVAGPSGQVLSDPLLTLPGLGGPRRGGAEEPAGARVLLNQRLPLLCLQWQLCAFLETGSQLFGGLLWGG